ncbi:MAG: S26 family signal peptidase [Fusobacteriaceae bacterium]|jgi:conjugative transfer signal peptidase TraF|nr:S26 family signal peptidase [Fusobacteriaceae bacterium]
MKINKPNFKCLIIVIPFFIILFLGHNLKKYYTINISESLPRGLYRLEEPKNIQKGDIVQFYIPPKIEKLLKERKYTAPIVTYMLKRVAALPGDKVFIKDNFFFVNDKNWGFIFDEDPRGNPLPRLSIEDFKLQDDEFLPLADAYGSYDGRYFGSLKISDIKFKCRLVFSF